MDDPRRLQRFLLARNGLACAAAALAVLVAGCASPDFTARADLSGLRAGTSTLSIVDALAPSPDIGRRYAEALTREAQARGYTVVAANAGQPALQLKAYLDAYPIDATRTAYAYVVQTSPDGRTRAERVNGAATVNLPVANAWSNLDDATLRQIARRSVDDLTRALSGNAPAPVAEE